MISENKEIIDKLTILETRILAIMPVVQDVNIALMNGSPISRLLTALQTPVKIDTNSIKEILGQIKSFGNKLSSIEKELELMKQSSLIQQMIETRETIEKLTEEVKNLKEVGVNGKITMSFCRNSEQIMIEKKKNFLISDLTLSVRAENAIARVLNMTWKQFQDFPLVKFQDITESHIYSSFGFGKKSLNELKEALAQFGIEIGSNVEKIKNM